MRRAILPILLAGACLLTAGCQREAGAETQRVREGVAAYRAGDHERLSDLLTKARDYDQDRNPCSTRAWAETRRDTAVGLLEPLDQDALYSVSEEARFVFLADHGREIALAAQERPLGCDGARHTVRRDRAQRRAMVAAYADAAALWRRDLEARYGETELRQRLIAADTTLRVNHVGETRLSRVEERAGLRRLAAWSR